MATQTISKTTTREVLVPTTVTETTEELRIILNLKTPEGCTKKEAVRFNNELIRLCKARGFTPMKKKATPTAQ